MNRRFMILAGLAALVLVASPLAAQSRPNGWGRGPAALEQLDLTEQQRNQLAQIREDTRSQMDAVLTEAQRQQLQQIRGQRQGMQLTSEQRQLWQQVREQGVESLTDAQRQQVQEWRAARRDQQGSRREMWREIDLNDTQRQQMRDLMQTAREQSLAVLTPDQQQQLQERRPMRRGGDRPNQ
jgi:Spy/CpxP family protein refolding chaperone